MIVLNVCSTTAQTVQTMIIGRLLAGIGIGISSAIVPLYISEVVIYQILRSLLTLNKFARAYMLSC